MTSGSVDSKIGYLRSEFCIWHHEGMDVMDKDQPNQADRPKKPSTTAAVRRRTLLDSSVVQSDSFRPEGWRLSLHGDCDQPADEGSNVVVLGPRF